MRLSRAEFKLRLQQLEHAMNNIDTVENVTQFSIIHSPLFKIVEDFMSFLSDMCDIPEDAKGNDALSYYVYELNFGEKYQPGCVTEANGDISPLSNPDELYDDLCKSWGTYNKSINNSRSL